MKRMFFINAFFPFELGSPKQNRQRRNQERERRTTANPFKTSTARAKTGSRRISTSGSPSAVSVPFVSGLYPSRRSRTSSASLKRGRRLRAADATRFVPVEE